MISDACDSNIPNNPPAWELEFIRKQGGYATWDEFAEKSNHARALHPKIFDWDDSKGKEAFLAAKERFRVRHFSNDGSTTTEALGDEEDMHADNIVYKEDVKSMKELYNDLSSYLDSRTEENLKNEALWAEKEADDAKKNLVVIPSGWDQTVFEPTGLESLLKPII